MCLGTPMQIKECHEYTAVCTHQGNTSTVDITLVGTQPAGTWLLVFLGGARQVLSEQEARDISKALEAINAVMSGSSDIDHLFADLVDREPQLPEHLTNGKSQ